MKSIKIIKNTREKLSSKLTTLGKVAIVTPFIGKTISIYGRNYKINGFSTMLQIQGENKGKFGIIVSGDITQPIKKIHKLGNVKIIEKNKNKEYGFFIYETLFDNNKLKANITLK